MLAVEHLQSGYGPINVLHGLSISVAAGEIVAMIGGQRRRLETTTLMTVSGVVKARAGSIVFDGRSATSWPNACRRTRS